MTNLGPWTLVIIAVGIGGLAAAVVFVLGKFFLGHRGLETEMGDAPDYNLEPHPEAAEERAQAEQDVFTHGSRMDRRQALRRGGNPIAVFLSDADGKAKPVRAYVMDRSTGGLCLSVPEHVQPGTILTVRAANAPPTVSWIQVEIRNCRPVGSEFEVGCRFLKTPPWSVLLLFG